MLHAIYQSAGLKSEGQGIAFSLAVDHVVGLSAANAEKSKEQEEAAKEVKENK